MGRLIPREQPDVAEDTGTNGFLEGGEIEERHWSLERRREGGLVTRVQQVGRQYSHTRKLGQSRGLMAEDRKCGDPEQGRERVEWKSAKVGGSGDARLPRNVSVGSQCDLR